MQSPWKQPGWQDIAATWVRNELSLRKIQQTGEVSVVRERPWSIVFCVPTATERLFFKALPPGLGYEPALVAVLAARFPDWLPDVVVWDKENCWFLMRDSGESLRSLSSDVQYPEWWYQVVRQYATIQQGMADTTDNLADLGVPDRRLHRLPEIFGHLMEDPRVLQKEDDPDGLTEEDIATLRRSGNRVQTLCQQLAESGIPETIEHSDLHDNNVFLKEPCLCIADWGDCVLAHPFMSLTVILRSIAYTLKAPIDAPYIAEIRAVYLREWAAFASMEHLEKYADLAGVLACINRAETWYHIVPLVSPAEQAEYLASVRGWLKEFLQQADRLAA